MDKDKNEVDPLNQEKEKINIIEDGFQFKKPCVPQRVFKPFKAPAFVSPARARMVDELENKMLKRIDDIFVKQPTKAEVEVDEEDPLDSLSDLKRKLELDDVQPSALDEESTSVSEQRSKKRKVELGRTSDGSPESPQNTKVPSEASSSNRSGKSCRYSVTWAKMSNKKHRVWEHDGILIVNENGGIRMTTCEGKVISTNSKFKMPDEIIPGETEIKLDGKIVGIQDVLPDTDLKKQEDISLPVKLPLTALTRLPVRLISKPFVNPGGNLVFAGNKEKGKPMFDPEAPNALVMDVPDRTHQNMYNMENDDIVPVVVDPHLSRYLRVHQREGVKFMYNSLHTLESVSCATGVILADEMGLGKTLQTVAVLWTMMKQSPYNNGMKEVKKALIVTPSSLVRNWEKEFQRWLGSERIRIFGVDSDHPLKECPAQYPVVIISYDMCTRSEELLKRMKFDLMICDEAHKLKNKNGQAYQLLIGLSCNRRILLTGTPIQNDLSELYSLVNFCIPGALGTEMQFSKDYEKPISLILDSNSTILDKQIGELKARELNQIMSRFFLRRDHSVMTKYLPPRVTYVIFCKPTPTQVSVYKKLLRNATSDTSATLSSILAMKKLCNHPSLVHPKNNSDNAIYNGLNFAPQYRHDQYPVSESGKLIVLVGILRKLQEDGEKVVLVSHYTQTLDILDDVCKAFNFPTIRLDGSTLSKQRQGIVDKFNSEYGDPYIFLLSSKAGGIGLNLQGACRIILYDIDWNPAHDMQAMARCWRPGQKRTTHIYRLVTTGTIEERIYLRQIKKQDLSGSVMDLVINNPTNFSPEELKDIFSLDTTEKCLTHDLMECDCKLDGSNKDKLPMDQEDQDDGFKINKKNIPIGELQKWEHFGAPFDGKDLDLALVQSSPDITFIFRNKSEEAPTLEEELPPSP